MGVKKGECVRVFQGSDNEWLIDQIWDVIEVAGDDD